MTALTVRLPSRRGGYLRKHRYPPDAACFEQWRAAIALWRKAIFREARSSGIGSVLRNGRVKSLTPYGLSRSEPVNRKSGTTA